MWDYNDNYLAHYGVIGMKWGVRRAEKNKEKARMHKRFADDYNPKKSLAKLSDRQKARMSKNREKELAKAKKYETRAKKIEQKHKDRTNVKTYNRVKNTSTAKLIGESLVLGTYGALKYNEARASGMKRGWSIVTGLLGGTLDVATLGIWRHAEPRVRAAKKRQRRESRKK